VIREHQHFFLAGEELPRLVEAVAAHGYRIAAHKLVDGNPVLSRIADAGDMPRGLVDARGPGTYEVRHAGGGAWFGITLGQDSWKRVLLPPDEELLAFSRQGKGFAVEPRSGQPGAPWAFVGMRPCDVAALARLDQVLLGGPYPDASYARRRPGLLVVAVECSAPGGTCFCAAAGAGPGLDDGYDLALNEVEGEGRHFFTVRPGSSRGREIIAGLDLGAASVEQAGLAREAVESARIAMAAKPGIAGLAPVLSAAHDHPHWQEVALRCLACGNCTMVCPTCFCHDLADSETLDGLHASRRRRWSSCFMEEFSYIHGGCIRSSVAARYRQWCSHKLAHWVKQFGVLGCVGCGRCVSFCPVGIDIAEEANAIANNPNLPGSNVGGTK